MMQPCRYYLQKLIQSSCYATYALHVKNSFGKDVRIHILNNSQNGYCPEDCHHCVHAKGP